MFPRFLIPALALAGLLVGAPGPESALRAQSADGAPGAGVPAGRPVLQHSFPLAGGTLTIVVDGLVPRAAVALQLQDPAHAPISVATALVTGSANRRAWSRVAEGLDNFTTLWIADEQGRVVLSIPLTEPSDANRPITLVAAVGSSVSEPLHLQVLPPTLVLPTRDGLQRINLLDGTLQLPAIPAAGGLRGAALSTDGVLGYVLRQGGLLEVRATHQWDAEPLSRRVLDPATDILAGSAAAGAAFALARPDGLPFTPAGQLQFLDDGAARQVPLLLEPMGQLVAGRRVVITPDGLSAFIAEDDLIVREIDLLTGRARGLLSVGLAGDRSISDLLIDGRQLLVATRGPLGRRGSLTSFDLDAGLLSTRTLDVDPLRLVPLDPAPAGAVASSAGRVLVVPAGGAAFEVLERGVPAAPQFAAQGERWLDAVAVDGGALLLRQTADGGRALERLTALTGQRTTLAASRLPAVSRLVGGGAGVVVLLGDPSGAVHVLRPQAEAPELLPGVTALPGEIFAVLP
jgi:hypothetical protein